MSESALLRKQGAGVIDIRDIQATLGAASAGLPCGVVVASGSPGGLEAAVQLAEARVLTTPDLDSAVVLLPPQESAYVVEEPPLRIPHPIVRLVGCGARSRISTRPLSSEPIISIENPTGQKVSGRGAALQCLQIGQRVQQDVGAAAGIRILSNGDVTIRDVTLMRCRDGLTLAQSVGGGSLLLDSVQFQYASGSAILCEPARAAVPPLALAMWDCRINAAETGALRWTRGGRLEMMNCVVESCGKGVEILGAAHVAFRGCRFEQNGGIQLVLDKPALSGHIEGCYFTGGQAAFVIRAGVSAYVVGNRLVGGDAYYGFEDPDLVRPSELFGVVNLLAVASGPGAG